MAPRLARISFLLAAVILATVALQLPARLNRRHRAAPAATAGRPLNGEEQARFEKGRAQFATVCAACHQPNGQGLPGLAPSLAESRWVPGDPRILARIVLNGKVQENLVMPPWKMLLTDEAIADALTFIRRSWGNDAEPVSFPIVAEARRETATREQPFSDYDLETLVLTLPPRPD